MPSALASTSLNPSPENGASRMDGAAEGEKFRAKRYAVKFQPPCIFLEYEDATKKRRVRAVKLNGVQPSVDVDRLTRKVIRSFPRKLDQTSVKVDQVRRLVITLVDFLNAGTNGSESGAAAPGRNGTASHVPSRLGPGGAAGAIAPAGSKAGLSRLMDRGGAMGSNLEAPLPSMSPRGFVESRAGPAARLATIARSSYPRASAESTMSRFSTSTASASGSSSGGEEEEVEEEDGDGGDGSGLDSALDELEREMAGAGSTSDLSTMANGGGSVGTSSELDSHSFSVCDRPLPPLPLSPAAPAGSGRLGSVEQASAGSGAAAGGGGAKTRFAAEAEKLTIGLDVTDDLDLNKVTELELKLAKQVMEQDFKKNQLRPGDPGYVYDKQAEFGPPTVDNDWDDSDDDEESVPSEEPEVDWADIHASVSKPKAALTTSVQVRAGLSSGSDNGSSSGRNGASQSPYNSNDWP